MLHFPKQKKSLTLDPHVGIGIFFVGGGEHVEVSYLTLWEKAEVGWGWGVLMARSN